MFLKTELPQTVKQHSLTAFNTSSIFSQEQTELQIFPWASITVGFDSKTDEYKHTANNCFQLLLI